jgi:hypothetical protein
MGVSIWQGLLSRDAVAAHLIVGLAVLSAFAAAIIGGHRRQQQSTRAWRSTWSSWRTRSAPIKASILAWAVLLGGTVAWDLVSFVKQSHTFPTLSYFIGHITKHEAGRGALFALWLALGAYFALGTRTKTEHGPR